MKKRCSKCCNHPYFKGKHTCLIMTNCNNICKIKYGGNDIENLNNIGEIKHSDNDILSSCGRPVSDKIRRLLSFC